MIIVVIPAKGNSSRLPNKNMSMINGRPMIQYTIDYAKSFDKINDIYVSTENKNIRDYCIKQNIKVISRPNNLCGETPIIDVYRHAFEIIGEQKLNVMVGLQPDHPERKLTLEYVYEEYINNKVDMLVSKDKNGIKNGAHYIMSRKVLEGLSPKKTLSIVDNCTNVHYKADLNSVLKNLLG